MGSPGRGRQRDRGKNVHYLLLLFIQRHDIQTTAIPCKKEQTKVAVDMHVVALERCALRLEQAQLCVCK